MWHVVKVEGRSEDDGADPGAYRIFNCNEASASMKKDRRVMSALPIAAAAVSR